MSQFDLLSHYDFQVCDNGYSFIDMIDGEFCVDDNVYTFATLYYRNSDIDAMALAEGFRELLALNFYN